MCTTDAKLSDPLLRIDRRPASSPKISSPCLSHDIEGIVSPNWAAQLKVRGWSRIATWLSGSTVNLKTSLAVSAVTNMVTENKYKSLIT